MERANGRRYDELRPVKITRGFTQYAEGSVLIEVGGTKVICTATLEDKVPLWLKGQGKGWITAEYGMLPRATKERNQREVSKGRPSGRTVEIQRLIGRALRSVVDLEALGEKSILIDCDVIQADGSTRTASITGSFVALVDALAADYVGGPDDKLPVKDFLAAVSVGVVEGAEILDLDFDEDSKAEVDMNVVMTGSGHLVEVQGTAEGTPFDRVTLGRLLDLGQLGIRQLIEVQKEVLGDLALRIGNAPGTAPKV